MSYYFTGDLCVRICPECALPLPQTRVRLYRPTADESTPAAAVANPKDTFALPAEDAVDAKSDRLLAETVTDKHGNFALTLDDDVKYGGGPLQVDVLLEKAPHQEAAHGKSVQVSITTLQPVWRQTDKGFVAVWRYCIPHRFWCSILARFDAWVICGWVRDCKAQLPVPGVHVSAFDADWLQDDPLGAAVTDGSGRFVIYYARSDFEKTPLSPVIDLELVGGPDLFFKVATGGGFYLLDEPRARGRDPDRENAGHCTCVTLCVEAPESIYENPQFTHIGDFNIAADIDGTTGLTNKPKAGHGGPDFGFFGALKLKGFCPKTLPSDPTKRMHYRFLFIDPVGGMERPITGGGLVCEAVVGARVVPWDQFGTGVQLTYQDIVIRGTGSPSPADSDPIAPVVPPGTPWGPVPPHVLVPDGDGWVRVDTKALDNGFQGTLVCLKSAAVVTGSVPTQPGAGNDPSPVAASGVRLPIIFETATDPADPASYNRQLLQAEPLVNNWAEVRQLDIQQFTSGLLAGCTPLSSDLNILFTADHEQLRNYAVTITTAATVPGGIPVLPSGTGPRGAFGNHHVVISTWPSCSYRVWLTTQRALTDGEDDDDKDSVLVTFCK